MICVCLNPCSNGICSRSTRQLQVHHSSMRVLILVLMEYALEDKFSYERSKERSCVLILVLMEYALEAPLSLLCSPRVMES